MNERELSDLEMLAVGALSPLTGFQGEDDYHAVLETMHLANGLAWAIPVCSASTTTTSTASGRRRCDRAGARPRAPSRSRCSA